MIMGLDSLGTRSIFNWQIPFKVLDILSRPVSATKWIISLASVGRLVIWRLGYRSCTAIIGSESKSPCARAQSLLYEFNTD